MRGADLCAQCAAYVVGIVEHLDVTPYSPAELLARIERQLPTTEPASPVATAVISPAPHPPSDDAAAIGQTQAGGDAGASPCRCWTVPPHDARAVNRWCDAHAAEWHAEHGALDVGHSGCATCARSSRDAGHDRDRCEVCAANAPKAGGEGT